LCGAPGGNGSFIDGVLDSPVPPTILLVDDDPALRQAMELILADEGYRVHTARHGGEALALLDGHPPDLILCDVTMPVLDGPGLLAEVRRRGHPVPIVLMSAVVRSVRTEPGLWFLPKPCDLEELLAVVARALAADPTRA
jgi:CheY-like chemotaxis protein